jgi:hypothetical protein
MDSNLAIDVRDQLREYSIDYTTSNNSFLKMYIELKKRNIQNNKYFLKIYDKSLIGVDPHSENLTAEQQSRILQEIIRNPWYFLREVVRISVPGKPKRYELHRGNLALSFCMLLNLNTVIELPRQNYKTISALCIYVWMYHFGTSGSNMIFGNKLYDDAKLNIKRFKDIVELLPSYLIFKNQKDDTDNIERIASAKNKNTIVAVPAATNIGQADKVGRGNTTPIQYYDEIAFLKFNKTILGASAPAASQATLEAKSNGKPYGKLLSTTPNNLDVPEGLFCKREIIDKAASFDESMYDWDLDRIYKYIQSNSDNDFIHIKFSYKELGRSEEWFKKQCRALFNDMMLIKREILLEWTLSSDNSPFNEEQLEEIKNSIKEPIGKLFIRDVYKVVFYEDLNKDMNYLIGNDVGAGLSQDNSAITIVHPITLKVVGEFRNSTIDTAELSLFLMELISQYMPNSVLIIERNSYGRSLPPIVVIL